MKSKIIIVVVILLLILGAVLYLRESKKEETRPSPQTQARQEQVPLPKEQGVGAEVYGKVENPVKGEVPEVNPFKEEYTNPFE